MSAGIPLASIEYAERTFENSPLTKRNFPEGWNSQ